MNGVCKDGFYFNLPIKFKMKYLTIRGITMPEN